MELMSYELPRTCFSPPKVTVTFKPHTNRGKRRPEDTQGEET